MQRLAKSRVFVLVAVIMIPCAIMEVASAQSKVGQTVSTFLDDIYSPRTIGMGGCTAAFINEQSMLYNPGAVGLFHMQRFVGGSFPSAIEMIPGTDALVIRNFGFSVGASATSLHKRSIIGDDVSLGLAYFRTHVDYAPFYETSYEGSRLRTFDIDQVFKGYTVAVGMEKYVRVGVGYTYKEIEFTPIFNELDDWGKITNGTHDFGVIVEAPISELAGKDAVNDSPCNFDLSVSGAYVVSNMGEAKCYNGTTYEFPKNSKLGVSCYGSCRHDGVLLGSIRLAIEEESPKNGTPVTRMGAELSVLDIIHLRVGRYDKQSSSTRHVNTVGFGVSMRGILAALTKTKAVRADGWLEYVMNNLDVSYQYASHDASTLFSGGPRKYGQFSLSL